MSAAVESTDVMNRRSGGVVVVVGVLSIVAGILAIVYPDVTLLALALIAGINLLLLGSSGSWTPSPRTTTPAARGC